MKILRRESIPPVRCSGEALELRVGHRTVARYEGVHGTFDEAIIFETDADLNAELEIEQGIGGIFAKQANR